MDVANRVFSVFVEELGIDEKDIVPQLAYNSIPEWDSVAHMHVVMSLEEAFELNFEDSEIAELTSVAKIIAAIERNLGSSA